METHKKIRDIMIDIFKFPHIPYWFTLKQSIGIIKHAFLDTKQCPYPTEILVFEEKYNLVGTLTLSNILKGLEPRFMKPTTKAQVLPEEEPDLSLIWDRLFEKESRDLAQRQVGDVMIPVKYFVDPDDPITKAAYWMIHHDLILLPVLEGKKKLVGVIRLPELFQEIADTLLKKRPE